MFQVFYATEDLVIERQFDDENMAHDFAMTHHGVIYDEAGNLFEDFTPIDPDTYYSKINGF